jgi:hypothetical protein
MEMKSAHGGNIMGDETEVSRDRSSWDKTSRGAFTSSKLLGQRNNETRGNSTQ